MAHKILCDLYPHVYNKQWPLQPHLLLLSPSFILLQLPWLLFPYKSDVPVTGPLQHLLFFNLEFYSIDPSDLSSKVIFSVRLSLTTLSNISKQLTNHHNLYSPSFIFPPNHFHVINILCVRVPYYLSPTKHKLYEGSNFYLCIHDCNPSTKNSD